MPCPRHLNQTRQLIIFKIKPSVSFHPDTRFQIALSLIPGLGPSSALSRLRDYPSAEAFFEEAMPLPQAEQKTLLIRADQELEAVEDRGFQAINILESTYPERLARCPDAPLVLFQKGPLDLNHPRALGIVGTRSATAYGKVFCQQFLSDLRECPTMIISGLAHGIDAYAHQAALAQEHPAVAVVAHGLDQIYPAGNRKLAQEMIEAGGAIVSDFFLGEAPERGNFPKRNRLIAGMSDALLLVEAKERGGALITADLANGYHREVFAVPGPYDAPASQGCLKLIKAHKAALLHQVEDLQFHLDWPVRAPQQTALPIDTLSKGQRQLLKFLSHSHQGKSLDQLEEALNRKGADLLAELLELELLGYLITKPGRRFQITRPIN